MITVAARWDGADFKRFLHLIQELSRGFDGILTWKAEASNETFWKTCIVHFRIEEDDQTRIERQSALRKHTPTPS